MKIEPLSVEIYISPVKSIEKEINAIIMNKCRVAYEKIIEPLIVKPLHGIQLVNDSVVNKIDAINVLSSSNARSVEEIASAAEHLARLAGNLSNTLSQFKTV